MKGKVVSCNLAVIRGVCSSAPDVRSLPSGEKLAVLQVTVRPPEGHATSVPVVVWSPPAWVAKVDAGDEVVVVGRVRRRFYQVGGAAASRVEVEAEVVARANDRRRLTTAL